MTAVVDLADERAKRSIDPDRFWKIRLAGERFWIRDPAPHEGALFVGIVENNLTEHPYRVGDEIVFGPEQIIQKGYAA